MLGRIRTLALSGALVAVVALASQASSAEAAKPKLKIAFMPGHTGTLIVTPDDKLYVLDADKTAAEQHIAPLLTLFKRKTIDAIIITHPHIDHFSGVRHLMSKFTVKKLMDTGYRADELTGPDVDEAKARQWYAQVVADFVKAGGKHVVLGPGVVSSLSEKPHDLVFKVLAPSRPWLPKLTKATSHYVADTDARVTNKNSLVLWVRHGGVAFLFTGDITKEAQHRLARNHPYEVRHSNVFSLPHHGKRYFDGDEFAKNVGLRRQARIGVSAADADKEDLAPWKKAGIRTFKTTSTKALTIESVRTHFTLDGHVFK